MLLSKFIFIIKRIFLCTTTGRNVNCGNDSSLIKGGSQNPICDKIVKKYFALFRNEKIMHPEIGQEWQEIYNDKGNIIYGQDGALLCPVDAIKIKGTNNRVFLSRDSNVKKLIFSIQGNNNKIFIGSATKLAGVASISGRDRKLIISNKTTFHDVAIFIKEQCDVYIGEDCMFSAKIEIRTSDSHSIFELDTQKRINKPGCVYIDDHDWLGKEVIVSKGVYIAKDCIVGAKSFVNKSLLEPNAIYAGCPAKRIRGGVNWTRKLLPFD